MKKQWGGHLCHLWSGPLTTLIRVTLVEMLSIKAALSLVIVVGFKIVGNRLILCIVSHLSCAGKMLSTQSDDPISPNSSPSMSLNGKANLVGLTWMDRLEHLSFLAPLPM